VSETIGTEFFSMLADQLEVELSAACVYTAQFLRGKTDRVRTLAACLEGGRMATFEFPMAGSPAAEVAGGNVCTYARDVRETFPKDRLLSDLSAEAFVGVPLNDAEGQVCGLIAALYRRPLEQEISFVQSLLKTFAPRASAELNRKQAEDVLRDSEQRYRTFVQMNPDACWRIEFDEPIDTTRSDEEQLAGILRSGYVAECNDALVQRLGLQRLDQLIGAPIPETVLPDNDLIQSCLVPLIRTGYRQSTVELTAAVYPGAKRGHYMHSHWGIVENGKLQRIWGFSRDITQLRETEAELRHAQKLESIGRLAAGVAHDFNNLLTIIQGYSDQLLQRTRDTDKAYIDLTEIRKAAEQGAILTSQLLAFSRKQDARFQLLDLRPIVADDERMLRRLIGQNIELTTKVGPSLGLVRADAGAMHQVLLNLAVNARDAMPKGGRLIIALSNVDIGETRPPRLSSVQPGPYVRLSVTDSGVGMSPDVRAHLFEPFFTTKGAQGTGLGLSTVYGIVRQSGGYIIVESELNKGTTFEVLLPRKSAESAANQTERPQRQAR
jgi:signal transduction histidine kinase